MVPVPDIMYEADDEDLMASDSMDEASEEELVVSDMHVVADDVVAGEKVHVVADSMDDEVGEEVLLVDDQINWQAGKLTCEKDDRWSSKFSEHRRRGCGRRRWFGSFARLGSATAPEARVLRGGRRTRRRRQSTELPEQESSDGARSCGSSCFPSNLATPPGQIRGRPEAANGDPPAGYRQTR
uniref:Uncharacterized protein n=1 Tax=Oryza nivara TaxID=4536 RepID=A0A0E0FXK6_ORYNI